MSNFLKNIGLALTYSPNTAPLLWEADRLKNLLNGNLTLIIIDNSGSIIKEKIDNLIRDTGIKNENIKIVFGEGDISKQIINISMRENIELLIAGALEQETIIKYYIGSVARKLMRDSPCPLLILKNPSISATPFKSFFVITDFSSASEAAIKMVYKLAILENAASFNIIRSYNIPALSSTILGTGSTAKINQLKDILHTEEEDKMKFLIKELNLSQINVKTFCIYGKEGWETLNFVKSQNADILAFHAPIKNLNFLDKFFPNKQEYYYHQLPSNLLIIR